MRRIIERVFSLLSFLSIIAMLGVVGNIDRGITSVDVGFVELLGCLVLAFIFALLAGLFKENNNG